jgi:hypothetical protein
MMTRSIDQSAADGAAASCFSLNFWDLLAQRRKLLKHV